MRNGNDDTNIRHSAASPETKPQTFVYTSLDLSQRSIRLIRVLPGPSPTEHIQCELRHANIEDEYICLSYVWGEPSHNWIEIDGQLHSVRNNLLSFLQVARQRKNDEWLWIDALCIDQFNIYERTHQVQQMGRIFSGAKQVVSWLGTRPEMVHFVRSACVGIRPYGWAYREHDYWERAWITQEILLARRVLLMADSYSMPLEHLPDTVIEESSIQVMQAYLPSRIHPHATPEVRGKSLVSLLHMFRSQKCQVLHDRVLSLLGLRGEGLDLEVNYSLPPEDLAWRVLLSCKDSLCLCGVRTTFRTLGVEYDNAMAFNSLLDNQRLIIEMMLPVV